MSRPPLDTNNNQSLPQRQSLQQIAPSTSTTTISDIARTVRIQINAGQLPNFTEAKLASLILNFDAAFSELQQALKTTIVLEQTELVHYLLGFLWCLIKKAPEQSSIYILAAKLWLNGAGYGSLSNDAFEQALLEYIRVVSAAEIATLVK
jgi:hypothetical protein